MTPLDTISTPRITVRASGRTSFDFKPLSDTTTAHVVEQPDQASNDLMEKLIALTMSDESLDWDALARIDIEGWGAETASE